MVAVAAAVVFVVAWSLLSLVFLLRGHCCGWYSCCVVTAMVDILVGTVNIAPELLVVAVVVVVVALIVVVCLL